MKLRELQDETGGLVTFIPLAFHPQNIRPSAISPEDDGLSRYQADRHLAADAG